MPGNAASDPTANDYQIVMEKVPDDRQPETALFLSGCFSLPPASTRGIAASAPIALLSDLTPAQAEAVMAELRPSLTPEVELRIARAAETTRISRLQWPRPPRIYGRDIAEFAAVSETRTINCPICGGAIRLAMDAAGVKASAADEAKKPASSRKISSRKISQANDKDPLFSGIKPLAAASGNLASIRSLQAGDTGFWMDHTDFGFSSAHPEPPAFPQPAQPPGGGSSTVKRAVSGRSAAGLAAFMKPGVFSVVVGRTRDNATVKMIAEIMGIGESEARMRALNLGLCVARDISLNEAQNLLARFKKLGARARIVRPS